MNPQKLGPQNFAGASQLGNRAAAGFPQGNQQSPYANVRHNVRRIINSGNQQMIGGLRQRLNNYLHPNQGGVGTVGPNRIQAQTSAIKRNMMSQSPAQPDQTKRMNLQ